MGAPGKCRTQSSKANLARASPPPASHFLALTSIDDSAPRRAQLTGKRAPTPCHDTGLADPVRRIPPRTRVVSALRAHVVYRREVHWHRHHHDHAIVSRRQVANPPNRLHATGADRRTSLTAALLCMSRVAAECHEKAQAAHPCARTLEGGVREIEGGLKLGSLPPTAVRVGKGPSNLPIGTGQATPS